MSDIGEIERGILLELVRRGPCSIDEMVTHLSGYAWNQIFSAVDRLSRCERVTLRPVTRFEYHISLRHVMPASVGVDSTIEHTDLPVQEDQGRAA